MEEPGTRAQNPSAPAKVDQISAEHRRSGKSRNTAATLSPVVYARGREFVGDIWSASVEAIDRKSGFTLATAIVANVGSRDC